MTREERKACIALIKIAKLLKGANLSEQDEFAVLFSALVKVKKLSVKNR